MLKILRTFKQKVAQHTGDRCRDGRLLIAEDALETLTGATRPHFGRGNFTAPTRFDLGHNTNEGDALGGGPLVKPNGCIQVAVELLPLKAPAPRVRLHLHFVQGLGGVLQLLESFWHFVLLQDVFPLMACDAVCHLSMDALFAATLIRFPDLKNYNQQHNSFRN